MSPSRLATAAQEYARRGFPVMPCVAHGKVPITKHGLKDASIDEQLARDRWHKWPTANIAIRTGDRFDVCDIDGPDALDALCTAAGFDDSSLLTTGPVAETPRGWHLFFAPSGSGNRAGFVPGCDWRGRNGYVVVPPSMREGDSEYVWLDSDEGLLDLDRALPAVPDWLHELLARNGGEERRVSDSAKGDRTRTPGRWARFLPPKSPNYFAAALDAEAHAVAHAAVGTRNDQLNRSTHALGRLDGLASSAIETVMLAAALDAGLAEHEALATIRSALTARGHHEPHRRSARRRVRRARRQPQRTTSDRGHDAGGLLERA